MLNGDNNHKAVQALITIGVFNAVFIAVFFAVGLSLSFMTTLVPAVALIMPVLLALPGGIIYFFMVTKAPANGVFLISGTILGIFMVAAGNMAFFLLCMTGAGMIAELLFRGIGRNSFWGKAAGFASIMAGFVAGGYFPMIFMHKAYLEFQLARGVDSAYLESMLSILSLPAFAGILLATAGSAILGSLWGHKLLHKHLSKAG